MSAGTRGPLVRFLGTGTPLGMRGLQQACILVETEGQRLLIDCGMTALSSLGRIGLDPHEIEAVVISHLHGDHFGGLAPLLLDARLRARGRPLTIVGPARTRQRVAETLSTFGWDSASIDAANFVSLDPGVTVPISGCELTGLPVDHDRDTDPLGIRLTAAGVTIGYSGDAGWSQALVEIARGVDLFICGVWSFDTPDPTFLDLSTLLRHTHELDCRRIILTHLGPSMLEHMADVPLEIATDGLSIQL